MKTPQTLEDLFLDELSDMYDAEKQLVKRLLHVAEATTCVYLNRLIVAHMQGTKSHITKIETVFELFGKKARNRPSDTTRGLLEESDEMADKFEGSPAINAALICATQRIEQYQIASYGCLYEWAGVLESDEAARLLKEILEEEKAMNAALTELARTRSNQEALGDPEEETSEEAPGDE